MSPSCNLNGQGKETLLYSLQVQNSNLSCFSRNSISWNFKQVFPCNDALLFFFFSLSILLVDSCTSKQPYDQSGARSVQLVLGGALSEESHIQQLKKQVIIGKEKSSFLTAPKSPLNYFSCARALSALFSHLYSPNSFLRGLFF